MYNYNQSSFPTPGSLEIRSGNYFNYVVPSGWRVIEDGQFAVVLFSPDNAALTIMVGNSGLPVNYNPWQFVYEKLLAMQPYQLQMSQPRQAQPIAGCTVAYEFDCTYIYNGIPYQGIAKCSVAYSYNLCTMMMTCAASHQSHWANYASCVTSFTSAIHSFSLSRVGCESPSKLGFAAQVWIVPETTIAISRAKNPKITFLQTILIIISLFTSDLI